MSAMDSSYGRPAYKTVGRMVCDTLHIGDLGAFEGLSLVLRVRLSAEERMGLAWAALRACDDEEVIAVALDIIPPEARAGWPMVPIEDVVSEAAFWADHASPAELRAYAAVCLNRLSQTQGRAA